MISKVTDPSKRATDATLLKVLAGQGIDRDYVEFTRDYAPGNPSAKLYRDLKSGRSFAVIGALPKVTETGAKIEIGWDSHGKLYKSRTNVFSAVVEGTQISLSYQESQLQWNPQLFIGGVEVPPFSEQAVLLPEDPDNDNYQNNILEWDYGVCKRRLRLVHGGIYEKWVFPEDPQGEVRIKHNQSGNLKLGFSGAADSGYKPLGFTATDDEEIVPAGSMAAAVYPVFVGGSLTAYATTSNAFIYTINSDYDTAHDAASGTVLDGIYGDDIRNYHSLYSTDYYIYRGFLYFDTSSIGAGETITAATLSLYGEDSDEYNAGYADLGIVEGVQNDPPQASDFGAHLNKTTLGADSYYDYDSWSNSGYNDKALNATGIGWINKTGTTKFCTRCRGDILDYTPTGWSNHIKYWANEKGSGYQPKLVITYETGGATEKDSSDAGTGTDAKQSFPAASIDGAETGTGAETSGIVAGIAASDVGAGVDHSVSTAEEARSGNDRGSGTDAMMVLVARAVSGFEMNLPDKRGRVGLPNKGVNL